jgi:hypothetical protein
MKAVVVYDSFFGNTEQIARAIGDALGLSTDVTVLRGSDVTPEHIVGTVDPYRFICGITKRMIKWIGMERLREIPWTPLANLSNGPNRPIGSALILRSHRPSRTI